MHQIAPSQGAFAHAAISLLSELTGGAEPGGNIVVRRFGEYATALPHAAALPQCGGCAAVGDGAQVAMQPLQE